MSKLHVRLISCCVLSACIAIEAPAQAAAPSAAEIAKKLANPIASMISVPFQSNTDVGIGANYGSKMVLNVQPVIPFALGSKVNLITRWIVPFVSQIDITGEHTSQAGLGDATITTFFGPANGSVTWGVGPAFIVPIATDDLLGQKQFALGPSIVALKQANGWTVGALANYIVSVSGDTERPDIKAAFVNPFLAYNWPSGAGITLNTEYTHDVTNDVDILVVMPVLTALTKFGGQTTQFVVGPRLHFAPDGHARYGLRAQVSLVFAK